MTSPATTRFEPQTSTRRRRRRLLAAPLLIASTALGALSTFAAAPASAASTFLGSLPTESTVASTVPANGDVNPYGVAVVRHNAGDLHKGDVLISNFNNSSNLQGTGTTIVQVSPAGQVSVFATLPELPGGTGLTTALDILPHGFVVVGSLPTSDGTSATATAGALLILNSRGHLVETIQGGDINGPWDMTAISHGPFTELFVTNVLNDTVAQSPGVVDEGTVVRLDLWSAGSAPRILSNTIIGSGFPERTDPAALVVGPTGVALGAHGTLYVADTAGNRIAAIPNAVRRSTSDGTGTTVSAGAALNSPLGLTVAPNGDIITVNGGDGNAVETTPHGTQVSVASLDGSGSPPGAGALFGLAVAPNGHGLYFVDDAVNTLMLLSR